jgi:tetratricopeptide (TPR) repeat protein
MSLILRNIFIGLFTFLGLVTHAQRNELSLLLEKKTDSLAIITNVSYKVIQDTYRRFDKDSIAMHYLSIYSKKNSLDLIESYALNALAIYCRNTSQYKAALDYHKMSLQKAIEADNIEMHIISFNMLGVVHRRMDAVQTALDYHYKAITLAESVTSPNESIKRSIAVSLNSMGNIFLALNQYELAIEKFNKSLGIEKSVDNKLGLAINYHNIGYAKEALGLLDEALENYKISLAYNNEINSSLGQVICNNSIAHIYIEQEKYQQGIEIILASLDQAKSLRDKFHLVGLYNNLGLAYLNIDDYKTSHRYLSIALGIAKEHKFTSAIANAYKYLSLLAELEKKFELSLQHYKAYEAYEEEVRNEKNFQYINDLIVKYDTKNISNQVEELSKEYEVTKY